MKNKNTKASWHLLITKPHKDEVAEVQLNNQGYEAYRPLAKYLKNYRGKKVQVVDSLFPRYLFINMREGIDDWGPIRSTRGIQGIVKFGIHPAKVENHVIAEIKLRESSFIEKAININNFKKGQTVKIDEGPLSGLDAIFSDNNGENRVIILLDFLGKQTLLNIDKNNISPI